MFWKQSASSPCQLKYPKFLCLTSCHYDSSQNSAWVISFPVLKGLEAREDVSDYADDEYTF